MPKSISADNKANNKLFMLPLLLGIMGFIFQIQKARKDFAVTGLLFFFTGIAIVIYLNQVSLQPRERDYAYVGSFYAFAIWIGLGVLQVIAWLNGVLTQKTAAIAATGLCLLLVPALMAQQEWDDHDRSQKTLPRDLARNYLESCPPNAILFSFGDNDTYPLWYAQEVEGIRPDVRVVVNSLLGSDWYMKELRYKVNQSEKFDLIFSENQVAGNKLNYAVFTEVPGIQKDAFHDMDSVLRNIVGDTTGKYRVSYDGGQEQLNIFPTRKFKMQVNKANAIAAGIAKASDSIVNEMFIEMNPNKQYLVKNELAMYAIIATSQFKRPICFTSKQELKELGLEKYVRQTGLSYQLVPMVGENAVNTEVAYNNIMTKFTFGNAKNSKVYFDEENRRHLNSMRYAIAEIAQALIAENKKDKAKQILRKIDSETSELNFPYGMTSNRGNQHDYFSYVFLQTCYAAGDMELAKKVSNSLLKDLSQQINYYKSLGDLTEDLFVKNLEIAYQGNESLLSYKQTAFINDALTAYQLKNTIEKMAEDAAKLNGTK
jgi:hypothetical protein